MTATATAPPEGVGMTPKIDEHEALTKIRAAESCVAACELELSKATEVKKQKQAAFDGAVANLRQTIREQSEVLPLFDQDDESWRATLISELISDGRTLNALNRAELETLGALTDWLNKNNAQITDIAGIGEAGADKLQAALDDYWAKNGRPKTESDDE